MRFTRWDQVFSEKDTHATVQKLVTWHMSQIKNASERERLLGVLGSDTLAICKFDLDYTAVDASDAYHIRQALGFFSKRRDLKLEGIDRKAVALTKFRESEQKCLDTNHRFKLHASGRFCFRPDVESVFFRAQRIIARILGDVPGIETLNLGFGPGATTQTKRKISSPRSKLGQRFCCSEDLLPLVSRLLEEMPSWVEAQQLYAVVSPESEIAIVDVEVQPCRLSFVPKNALTDRGICTEPSLNVMLQKGIGQYMSRRLLHFGVDLRDQEINKSLACTGSITGALATLDLSSASDLIATEVVYHLLPLDWFFFLSYARSSKCVVEGEEIKLQKFSSMGNGFTFPLESLIFYALAKAACPDDTVSVYGDDIIVPTERVDFVIEILETAGFLINTEKSCTSGPFRESCGGDYLLGSDIRPFYLRDKMSCQYAFMLHNFYVRRGLLEPASILKSLIADHVLLYGPDGYGDGHLLGDWSPQPKGRDRGWSGYTFDTYTWKSIKDFKAFAHDHVLPCYSIYAEGPHFELETARYLDPYADRPSAFPSFRAQQAFYRNGALGVTIPGTRGYKRISIYVLESDCN